MTKYITIIACLFSLLFLTATTTYTKTQSKDIRFVAVSDLHYAIGPGLNQKIVNLPALVTYINNLDPLPEALILGGDLVINTHQNLTRPDTLLALLSATLDSDIDILPVLGNWEGDYDWRWVNTGVAPFEDGEFYDDANADPFAVARTYLRPWIGSTKGYYYREYGTVKIMITNNIVDTIYVDSDTVNAYANCNPPGRGEVYWEANDLPTIPNPDYSGFITENSAQWNWLREALTSHTNGTWNICAGHRAIYTPIDEADYGERPNIYTARYGIAAMADSSSVDLWLTGDVHLVSMTKRVHRNAITTNADSIGSHYLSLAGGFFYRDTLNSVVPENSLLYAYDDVETPNYSTGIWFAVITINGDRGYVEISVADTTGDIETSEIVEDIYDYTIINN